MPEKIKYVLCSACLLGVNCRYDGKSKPSEKVLSLLEKGLTLIPVCPEQLGGLPTPRTPAEGTLDGRVLTKDGFDVTENFLRGAEETLKIAKLYGAQEAILKQKSPSCGSGKIPDGTFTGKLVDGDGITAALLKKDGIKVISEEDLSGKKPEPPTSAPSQTQRQPHQVFHLHSG